MRVKMILGMMMTGLLYTCTLAQGQEPPALLQPSAVELSGDTPSAPSILSPNRVNTTPESAPAQDNILTPNAPQAVEQPQTPLSDYVRRPNGGCCEGKTGCYNAGIGIAGDGGAPIALGLSYLSPGLSDYLLYRRNNCCEGPKGPCKPLYVELYLRNGVAVGVGGTTISRDLDPGWIVQGGGRSLFFNEAVTSAWVIDAGIVNINNTAGGHQQIPLSVLVSSTNAAGTVTTNRVNFGQGNVPGVTMTRWNETFVSGGIGKEYYLFGNAKDPGNHWRIGWDYGGRYGSGSMDFNEIRHRTRVLEGMYAAAHTDYEYVCGHCIYSIGLRTEWSYTWSTIFQTQSDTQLISTMVNLGVRY